VSRRTGGIRTGEIVGTLCLTVLAVTACSAGSTNDVTVAMAVSGTIATDVGGLGTVTASVDVPLALSFTDQVEDVRVVIGQQVRKGQPLLTLDPQPLIANVSHLEAREQHAQADVARLRADLASGRTSQALVPNILDQEQTAASQASLYGQLLAEAQGQGNTLTSPIKGYVLAVNVQAGEFARPGAILVEIVDYHRITVTAELPVSAQPEIKPGDPTQLSFAAAPSLTLTGTVTGVSPGTVNHGTGFLVTVDAPNTADQRVHPGYQAYVQVPYASQGGAVVRRMAILIIGLAPAIFVVQGDVVQLRQVQVGAEDGTDVQIVSGIQPGEEYVLVGNENLANGDRVRITSNLGPLGGKSG
jgi:membrane fusion protein, multidrug efflux system